MAYVRNSKKPKSCTAFSVKNGEKNITALENTALIQADQVDIKKGRVYGQIHNLYTKKGTYQKPEWNNEYKFIFNDLKKEVFLPVNLFH